MAVSMSPRTAATRVFVETWAPAGLAVANSPITAMIYRTSPRNGYIADIRRAGELIQTVSAATLPAVKAELGARATSL